MHQGFFVVAGVGLEPHDLRVMSPTSYQLLYPAILVLWYYSTGFGVCQPLNVLFLIWFFRGISAKMLFSYVLFYAICGGFMQKNNFFDSKSPKCLTFTQRKNIYFKVNKLKKGARP